MRLGPVVGLLFLALAAGAAWRYADLWDLPLPSCTAPEAPSASAAGLRKCDVEGRVLYTNGRCPTVGSERPLTGGSVSVMPSQRAGPPVGQGASAMPHARDLLLDPRAVDIKDQRMEEVIGK